MAIKMKGVGIGGYRVVSTDEQVAQAIMQEIEETGSWHLQSIVSKCKIGRGKARRVAREIGAIDKLRNLHLLENPKHHGVDDTLVSACQEAIAENDLNNGLGVLLSILTGTPLSTLKKMAAGEAVNIEILPRTGAVFRRYQQQEAFSYLVSE